MAAQISLNAGYTFGKMELKLSEASGVWATRWVVHHKRVRGEERWIAHGPTGPSTGDSRWAGELSTADANFQMQL